MRPLQAVVDQAKEQQVLAYLADEQRKRVNIISLAIIFLSIVSTSVGAGFMWGWPAIFIAAGLCFLPIGVLLGISNKK